MDHLFKYHYLFFNNIGINFISLKNTHTPTLADPTNRLNNILFIQNKYKLKMPNIRFNVNDNFIISFLFLLIANLSFLIDIKH